MTRGELIRECFGRDDLAAPDLSIEVRAGENVVSHVGIYWRTILLGGEAVQAAGIGLVCTAPGWRKLGLATKLVELAHVEAQTSGVWVAALWSAYRDFYEPLGYVATSVPNFLVFPLRNGLVGLDGEIDPGGQW